MKTIKINDFDETLFYEKLDNGLEIFLVPLKNKNNYYISFNVKYGNSYMDFKENDRTIHVPSGIAHFLEHKLFEREDIVSPFEYYATSGTDVNAATSINYTSYYCSGNNKFKENLEYLLNWITKVNITEEKVEKEKGIIIQESRMHADNPIRLIYDKLRSNSFIKDNYGEKVIGEEEDIQKITKEDLEITYKDFYRPDNMFVIAVGNFDEKETIKVIKNNLKSFKNNAEKIQKINISEPKEVLKREEQITMNISTPRIALGYKIDYSEFKLDKYKIELIVSMILKIVFGNTSVFYEEGLKNNLFIDFNYGVDLTYDKIFINIIAITERPDQCIEAIKNELNNIKFNIKDIERIKKVWIAGEIKSLDNITVIANDILYDVINYGRYINNEIEELNKICFKDIDDMKKKLIFDNVSIVKVFPKNDVLEKNDN